MDDAEFPGLSEHELRELTERYRKKLPVISIASGASGSGKSMLAVHLAVQAEKSGAGPVVVMDTVSRGTFTAWWNKRKLVKPPLSSQGGASRFMETLDRLSDMGAKLCLIDTAPVLDEMVEQVVAASTLVVVPCRPEPKDLFAADATAELAGILGRKSIFVLNWAMAQARMTEAVMVELAKHGTVAPVIMHRRREFVSAMEKGLTVMELEDAGDASQEVEKLWDYLQERLSKIQ